MNVGRVYACMAVCEWVAFCYGWLMSGWWMSNIGVDECVEEWVMGGWIMPMMVAGSLVTWIK